MQDRVTLPQWLDNLIFEQLGAKYCRSNADMTVIDWDKDDVLNYLGTYFPRSYAEAYCIFTEFLTKWPYRFVEKTELSVFDFGCGTGGEIIGFLDAVQNMHNIQKVRIYALDGNYHALRLLENIVQDCSDKYNFRISLDIIPLTIEDFYDLDILSSVHTEKYDIFMSFKAICEFVSKERFEQQNAYAHIAKTYLSRLNDDGIMVLADVTSYNDVSQEWLPRMMDYGLAQADCSVILKNDGYNQTFVVDHKKKRRDISKIAWRIACPDNRCRNIEIQNL